MLEEATGFHTYLPVVSKLASLFRHLEEQERFLSYELSRTKPASSSSSSNNNDDDDDPTGKSNPPSGNGSVPPSSRIHAILEILLEDLNTYSETQIPITATSTTLNIKLFPIYPSPPPVHAHHVPLLTAPTALRNHMLDRTDEWDITLCRIMPHIDGINHVKKIGLLADVEGKLVRKAVRELCYYGCVVLGDVFAFGNVYAGTEKMGDFVRQGEEGWEEGRRYVGIPQELAGVGGASRGKGEGKVGITGRELVELYASMRQGLSVKAWVAEQRADLVRRIDVRRFVTYGVLKGILYRVHKWPISDGGLLGRKGKGMGMAAAGRGGLGGTKQEEQDEEKGGLGKWLDGTHCFDEICTELMISEKELMARLKAWGDVQIISR